MTHAITTPEVCLSFDVIALALLSYRVLSTLSSLRLLCFSDPYGDPYYDYEMEAFWRGGQYENFRVQYTETPLPYHFSVSLYMLTFKQ